MSTALPDESYFRSEESEVSQGCKASVGCSRENREVGSCPVGFRGQEKCPKAKSDRTDLTLSLELSLYSVDQEAFLES